MPRSSSTSSSGKSSTRISTSPASLRNASGSSASAASAMAANSSSEGASASFQELFIGHDDMRRFGRTELEEADVQRLLRLDRLQGLAGHRPERGRVQTLARRLAGLPRLRQERLGRSADPPVADRQPPDRLQQAPRL